MPQHKKPIDARLTGPVVEFAEDLRALRAQAGDPPYAEMARKSHASKSVLSAADSGKELPTPLATRAYVLACGADPDEWESRRQEVKQKICKPDRKTGSDQALAASGRPAPPRPIMALTPDDFRDSLRELYDWAGSPAYRELTERARKLDMILARSTISDMLSLKKSTLPTSTKLIFYLAVCLLPADQHGEWLAVREAIVQARGRDRRRSLADAPSPTERVDEPMVPLPAKGTKKVNWQAATADLPLVKPLLDVAWGTLPEPVARQLEKGEDIFALLTDPGRSGTGTDVARSSQAEPERQWRWTSEPPLPVTIFLCLLLLAVVSGSIYVVVWQATR